MTDITDHERLLLEAIKAGASVRRAINGTKLLWLVGGKNVSGLVCKLIQKGLLFTSMTHGVGTAYINNKGMSALHFRKQKEQEIKI